MQWDSGALSGFSSTKSWIEINPDYVLLNVEQQEKNVESILSKYKQLVALRNAEPILQYGDYKELSFENKCILFARVYKGVIIKCYFNFGDNTVSVTLNKNENILLGELMVKPNNYLIIKTIR